jgi:splicing factor 45
MFQHGQGLGRSEQGMAQALAVEKTSKRGGRIIHEKDLMPPPMFGESFKTPATIGPETPPWAGGEAAEDDDASPEDSSAGQEESKPSITDLLKNPTKVVMCRVSRLIPSTKSKRHFKTDFRAYRKSLRLALVDA